ncbi:DUF5333 domain-containing protein [Pacificoceanicola onchidii]|uniref:DUF5333 domain-containing protein n=1 Tax=Pacificoceanicola onchidii TaxID=2562685 RepID=UPI0010A558C9|nr:DUF5333 domain-containing protein [Pacificoceanicola onchidii]
MRPISKRVLVLALGLGLAGQSLAAKPPLRDVAEIDNGLMAIAIADEIRKTCDGISARMIRAYSTIKALESRAGELGYSEEEIEDYVTSKTEKKRMRAKASAYLAGQGVDADNAAALCAFGERQIAKGTAIGVLLR